MHAPTARRMRRAAQNHPKCRVASRGVNIERFIWTVHAEDKRAKRMIDRIAVERAILNGHADRQINRGDADWRIYGLTLDGRNFAVLYDHPCRNDDKAVRIVTVLDAPDRSRWRVT
jgi:hypothetical protein